MLDIHSQSQTLLQDLPVSMIQLFFGKKENLWSWGYSPQVPDYQDFHIFRHQIKGILLYYQISVCKQTTKVESLSGSSSLCAITISNRYQVGESKHNTLLRCKVSKDRQHVSALFYKAIIRSDMVD